MKVWFDTEFIDTGAAIHLLSVGMVREDGAEYYAEDAGAPLGMACPWVRENVLPKLTGASKPRHWIADDVKAFVGEAPDFWAWYGAHDWVVLTQLYGRMISAPESWPMFVRDLAPIFHDAGEPVLPENPGEHNALVDARWTRKIWQQLVGK